MSRLARSKARAGYKKYLATTDAADNLMVLGADTSVVIDDDILGKPCDQGHAISMLMRLSGRTHKVFTAVALCNSLREQGSVVVVDEAQVTFRHIGAAEAHQYWQTGEPKDKAGGYGIQGNWGYICPAT